MDEYMIEDELRERIIELKETGSTLKQKEAFDLYSAWTVHNLPASAHTIFHGAHALLLGGGSIEDCDRVADRMKDCIDYTDVMWGDWLADTAMALSSRGKDAAALNRLNHSTDLLRTAPRSKQLRNRFFYARIQLRHGDNRPHAVSMLWQVREALLQLRWTDEEPSDTLLRNVNWWLLVASARYQRYQVRINDAMVPPFDTAYLDMMKGAPWIRETRASRITIARWLKYTGPIGKLIIGWLIIRKSG